MLRQALQSFPKLGDLFTSKIHAAEALLDILTQMGDIATVVLLECTCHFLHPNYQKLGRLKLAQVANITMDLLSLHCEQFFCKISIFQSSKQGVNSED